MKVTIEKGKIPVGNIKKGNLYIHEESGAIVLALNTPRYGDITFTGTCLKPGSSWSNQNVQHSTSWDIECYTLFTGKVILENEI